MITKDYRLLISFEIFAVNYYTMLMTCIASQELINSNEMMLKINVMKFAQEYDRKLTAITIRWARNQTGLLFT